MRGHDPKDCGCGCDRDCDCDNRGPGDVTNRRSDSRSEDDYVGFGTEELDEKEDLAVSYVDACYF